MYLFENAFRGKTYELSRKLEVSLDLLCLLHDKQLLTDLQLESLKANKINSEKVGDLLQILRRLENSKFDTFCSVLETVGQSAIVRLIRPDAEPTPQRLDASQNVADSDKDRRLVDLEETIEVDYGLPVVLRKHQVLTSREWENIAQHRDDHRREVLKRVSLLLEFALKKLKSGNENVWSALNSTPFRDSLCETKQPHIVNFIEAGGMIDLSKFGDVWPLNEQQRLRLLPSPDVIENSTLNSQDRHITLLAMLLEKGVISVSQQEYIGANVLPSESNERLLLIMKRRSVADVKTFLHCLLRIGCKDVVDKFNRTGIIVCIHSTINSKTMTREDKQKKESLFVKFLSVTNMLANWFFGKTNNSEPRSEVCEALECLQKNGCVLMHAEPRQSIAWYIHCQTKDSLDGLRHMYDSNELARVLHVLFNSGWHEQEPVPLHLEWRAGIYEFHESSIPPFGTFFDALSMLDAVPLHVLELVLWKAYIFFYNVRSVKDTTLSSSDVAQLGAILLSADFTTHVTLSSVCLEWWKLITRPDRKIRKQQRVIKLSLPSTGVAIVPHAAPRSGSSSPQADSTAVSKAPSVGQTFIVVPSYISGGKNVSDEPHLGEHVSGDMSLKHLKRRLKRRLEDAEPAQPTKKPTPSTEIAESSTEDQNASNFISQLSKDDILFVPLGKPGDALPWVLVEMIVLKTAIIFHQFYRVRLLPRADMRTLVTVSSVCKEWHTLLTYRKYNRRQLRNLFQQKLTGVLPLELLKAAVLFRRHLTSDALTSKPLEFDLKSLLTSERLGLGSSTQDPFKSDIKYAPASKSLKSDREDFSAQDPLKSVDHKVLVLLASVCRHWRTTIKTRNALSRRQLCLMLHDDGMRRMIRQLHRCRVQVLASLCVTDDLIQQLADAKCISGRQANRLFRLPLSRRSSRLLNMMQLKNVHEYKVFVGVLRRTAREDIAILLESPHVIYHPIEIIVIDFFPNGLTVMNSELFVRRNERSGGVINVYSTTTFELLRTLNVSSFAGYGIFWMCALTSCDINRCLYVSDVVSDRIYKIDSKGNELMRWRVDGKPSGLSVSRSTNIIVTCFHDICEYTSSGSLVNRVHLPLGVYKLLHSVELSTGEYVVSHSKPVHGVSVINREGRVVSTYRNDSQSNAQLWESPRRLAVTANDRIIVADKLNNKIITLNSTLSCARDLSPLLDYKLANPEFVYFDDSRSRLYVSESGGRVLIFEGLTDVS